MAILGPLAVGTRIQFQIAFTIPADFVAGTDNAVITDTLPNGLSLYLNNGTTIDDDKNAVKVGTTELVRVTNYTISTAGQTVTISVLPASLTAGEQLVATVDTIVNDTAALTGDLDLTNTASLAIGTSYVSENNATAEFTLVPLGTAPAIPTPAAINREDAVPINLELSFQAANPTATDAFNYFVDLDLPNELAQGTITGMYGDTAGAENTPLVLTPTATGVQFNNTDLAGKFIKLNIPVVTQNLTGYTDPSITGSYAVSLGGIDGLVQEFTIPFSAAPQPIQVTKTVVTR